LACPNDATASIHRVEVCLKERMKWYASKDHSERETQSLAHLEDVDVPGIVRDKRRQACRPTTNSSRGCPARCVSASLSRLAIQSKHGDLACTLCLSRQLQWTFGEAFPFFENHHVHPRTDQQLFRGHSPLHWIPPTTSIIQATTTCSSTAADTTPRAAMPQAMPPSAHYPPPYQPQLVSWLFLQILLLLLLLVEPTRLRTLVPP
jgi:hypothetical protein